MKDIPGLGGARSLSFSRSLSRSLSLSPRSLSLSRSSSCWVGEPKDFRNVDEEDKEEVEEAEGTFSEEELKEALEVWKAVALVSPAGMTVPAPASCPSFAIAKRASVSGQNWAERTFVDFSGHLSPSIRSLVLVACSTDSNFGFDKK
jgi:hypothetical protein